MPSKTPKSPISKLKHYMNVKECMTLEQKQRFLNVLKKLKESNIGGETDIVNADNLVSEEDFSSGPSHERNVVAKTFDTKADYDSYVNQRRGIEMTSKELQSIVGFKEAKPTQQDKFFVKYESSDDFGNNDTIIIKKLKEGNNYCWTAFIKSETASGETEDEEGEGEESSMDEASVQQPAPSNQSQQTPNAEVTVDDTLRIVKSITFSSDIEGANILSDFLRKLDI